MQKPFLKLIYLSLSSSEVTTVLPDSFLGGSAPHLQVFWLRRIPFPNLPKLLLSATHLQYLDLFEIPHSGYFSPEAIATVLSTLTSLRSLSLEFQSPRSLPERENRRPPPLRRSVLPIILLLRFKGVTEYLEDVVARIDAPRLSSLIISFFNQIVFDTPQTIQFINRTPRLKVHEEACLVFDHAGARVHLSSPNGSNYGCIDVRIPCIEFDWQVSSLEQICTSTLPPLSVLENLYIYENPHSPPGWKYNIENALWLELLHPFIAVKTLYLSVASRISPALQELIGDRAPEVFPTRKIFSWRGSHPSGSVQESIVKFVARGATALRSPYNCFPLGRSLRLGVGLSLGVK